MENNNNTMTHQSAVDEFKEVQEVDPVVHISKATERKGAYTKAQPIGYPCFDGSLEDRTGMMGGVRAGDLIIATGLSGQGKCHGKGTKILMFNGLIKNVEDIVVGDKLMGDDNTPRNVLSLANGKEMMYRIFYKNGDYYDVNESHILSLKNCHKDAYGGKGIKDICLNEFLKKSKWFKFFHKGYKVGVDFKNNKTTIDPYFLGLWLGDGSSFDGKITTMDKEIVEYLKEYAKKLKLKLKVYIQKNNKSNVYSLTRKKIFNSYNKTIKNKKEYIYKNKNVKIGGYGKIKSLKSMLKDLDLINNKHIPYLYKINSRDVRLKVLAGLIDSDGHKNYNGYQIIQKNKTLSDDIIFLCRSLGFDAHYIKTKIINNKKYYRISINGNNLKDIPVLLKRKKCIKRKQIKNPLHYGIKIKKIGIDDYYGFKIDGNHRYLLGDFTVTHNTTFFQNVSVNLSKSKCPSVWFSYEVLIDNLYAKFKMMGANDEDFLVYTPKKNTTGAVDWIKEKVKEGIAKFETKHVFIDHIDFLTPSNIKTSDQHRMVLRQICQELKNMAVELEVTVFLIAHVKKVQGRQIEMQDIAESAGIYQLADMVFCVGRRSEIFNDSGNKQEVLTNVGFIKTLKNRMTGEEFIMEFNLDRDNIINPLIPMAPKTIEQLEEEMKIEKETVEQGKLID